MLKLIRIYIFVAVALLLTSGAAFASTCSGTISDINLGSIELRTGVTNQSTASLTISCTGAILSTVGVCVRLGDGSGGAGANHDPRYLSGPGGSLLSYQLRPNGFSSSNGIWDDQFFSIPMLLGSGSISRTVYTQITTGTPSVPSGSYSSDFIGSDVILDYDITSCLDTGGGSTLLSPFTISGSVVSSCEVNASNMNFGTLPNPVSQNVDATAAVTVQCSQGEDYSIRLGLGNGIGVTDPAARKMSNLTNTISYGLYSNAARTTPWGNLSTNDVDSNGTGNAQLFNVYGRVHAGQTPPLGTYSDLIVITVEY